MQKTKEVIKKATNRFLSAIQSLRAFSILELVIVVAILAVFSTVGVVSLTGYRGKQNLKKTTDEIVAAISGTQKRSISQDAGSRWGLRFSNTTSSGSQYIIFSGTSYATSAIDKIYGLSNSMQFSEPSSGHVFDALFMPSTGALPSKKIISIVTGRGDGFVGDIIMNTAGLVTGRVENGLVGYWHFDEATSTTVYDASGMGNNGALSNGPVWQPIANCKAGGCLSFSGGTDQAAIASLNIQGKTDFSISDWQYVTTLSSGSWILNYTFGGTSFYSYQGGQFRIVDGPLECANSGFGSISSSEYLNKWAHTVFVKSGSTINVYVNGTFRASCVSINNPLVNPTFRIGNIFAGRNLIGTVDEVRIYNRPLSATEILNMYNDFK